MYNLLMHGAVPFGYTDEMNDSFYVDEYISAVSMDWQNEPRGLLATLPDVILSNTPPPSPLRRAHSYLSFFPEKAHAPPTTTAPTSLDTPPTTPAASLEEGRNLSTRAASVDRLVSREESVKTGLKHIQEVRRRVQNDPLPPEQHLPELSWPLPRPHRPRQQQGDAGQGRRRENSQREGENVQDEEAEEDQKWRRVGGDLRKIADQFQQRNDKVGTKGEDEEALSLAVPVALTRCLTASIFFLVWWRLFNKFH